jgi:hypothetical protein
MAQDTVLRPTNTNKGVVLVTTRKSEPPVITTKDGKTYIGMPAEKRGGKFVSTEKGFPVYQWVFPREVDGLLGQDITINYGGESKSLTLDPSKEYRSRGGVGGFNAAPNKDGVGGGGTGTGSGFDATQVGAGGVAPADLSSLFPDALLSEYQPIETAPYKVIDPRLTMKEYSPIVQELMQQNFFDSKQFGLETLNTELEGLQSFVPEASALKRQTIAEDNIFNQAERTAQLQSAIPDVLADQDQQAADFRTYASGRAPDSITDAALELGVRSNAADIAAASGFGSTGIAGRKLSDLMSAERRIQLSQYGNEALSNNAAQRAQLRLAPTSYSNAGEQVSAMPSVSAGQVQLQQAEQLNRATVVDTNTAFNSSINQSQFVTNLEQTSRQFNASNTLQNNQFNTTNQNNFALSKFNYLVSLANSYAQAAQNSLNLGISLDQQQEARNEATKQRDRTARNKGIQQVAQTAATAAAAVAIFSDERLKEDIIEYDKGLKEILELRPVSYRYISEIDSSGDKKTGILAQEYEVICPDSVCEINGFKAVDHTEIIFMLVNAVKKLSELVNRG